MQDFSAASHTPAPNVVARKSAPIPLTDRINNQGGGVFANDGNNVSSSSNEVKMDISMCHKCDLLFISKEEFLAHR